MTLTQTKIDELKTDFAEMSKDDLCEVTDILFDEAFKRDWEEINPIAPALAQEKSRQCDMR